jgi:hypothetical protein
MLPLKIPLLIDVKFFLCCNNKIHSFSYKILIRKPERPRYRWDDNIRLNLREVGCVCVEWAE